MTKKELVAKLEVLADVGDTQLAALTNILIDYFGADEKKIGFKKEDK